MLGLVADMLGLAADALGDLLGLALNSDVLGLAADGLVLIDLLGLTDILTETLVEVANIAPLEEK